MSKLLTNLLAAKRGCIGTLKLHPYVEKKMRALSQRIDNDALQHRALELLRIEEKLKTTRLPAGVALLRFIVDTTATLSVSGA